MAALGLSCVPVPRSAPVARGSASASAAAPPDPWSIVVLDNQMPAPIAGLSWARLQPGGRTVTLLPEGEGGARALAGSRLFAGTGDRFAAVDDGGRMELFQRMSRVASLGDYAQAAFSPGGEVFAWAQDRWAVFSSAGELLRGGPSTVALSRSGLLIERSEGGTTRLIELPDRLKLTTALDCRLFYPSAGRMVCVERIVGAHGHVTPFLHVISLDAGDDMRRTPSPGDGAFFGFNAVGTKLAAGSGDVQVYDIAADRWTTLSTDKRPAMPYRSPPRIAFTSDDAHVCAEEDGAVRVAPPLKLGPRTASTCFFVQRPPAIWADVGLATEKEWDAIVVTFPVTPGFEPMPRSKGNGYEMTSEALSPDGRTAVVMERSARGNEPSPVTVKYQALVIDVKGGSVRRTIHVTDFVESFKRRDDLALGLTREGRVLSLCAREILPGDPPCKSFDVETGSPVPFVPVSAPVEAPGGMSPPPWGSVRASSAIQVLAPPKSQAARRVLKWHDEGQYLSIDVGTDAGIEVHLNLPDSGDRVAEDVESVPDGSMVVISSGGAVELWQVQPIGLRATLVRAGETAWAALFPDGTFEWVGPGDAESAVACEREGALYPLRACAAKRRPAGALREIQTAAARAIR